MCAHYGLSGNAPVQGEASHLAEILVALTTLQSDQPMPSAGGAAAAIDLRHAAADAVAVVCSRRTPGNGDRIAEPPPPQPTDSRPSSAAVCCRSRR